MKKKVAILGSTGSIGKNLINILKQDANNFEIILLAANTNYKQLLKQSKFLKVKNLIISDKKSFLKCKKENTFKGVNIYNNFLSFNKIFKNKLDYTMCAITGIEGLDPTIRSIKYTKNIAIANKEAIICGWNLISKQLKKYDTNFIPVDSEHFSIWHALRNNNDKIEKVFLTASGGPFKDLALSKFKNIKINEALKHPNWKMGKKISIDSATMMNKVFEIIEAKNIFNIDYKYLSILIHPRSYVHALIKFKSGLINIIAHDTNMKIPISNSLYLDDISKQKIKTNKIEISILNKLDLKLPNIKRFPCLKIINLLPKKTSLFETIIVSANDALVDSFLNKKIKFIEINKKLIKFINLKEFIKYKSISPDNIDQIIELNNYVRFKIKSKSI
jgi:1-deoxy-D-xylulose-5-phosphate reductoisomerase